MTNPSSAHLDQAWERLDPLAPVPLDDPDHWYQDLADVRGPGEFVRKLTRQFGRRAPRPPRVLLLGHAGSGKSTELGRLHRALRGQGWAVLQLHVDKELNLDDVETADLHLLLVQRVAQTLGDMGVTLERDLVERVYDWFRDPTDDAGGTLELSVVPGEIMSWLASMLLKRIQIDLKLSAARRRGFRTQIDQRLNAFMGLVSDVVEAADTALILDGFKGLVLLVDGLEKTTRDEDGRRRATKILLDDAEQWARLACPAVFTAPLELLSESARLGNHYDEFFLVPAIPVSAWEGAPDRIESACARGRDRLRELVGRRIPLDAVFDDMSVFDAMVKQSGGSIRDLFRLIRAAIDHAEPGAKITPEAARRAWLQHALQVSLVLQPNDIHPLQRVQDNALDLLYDQIGVSLLQRELVIPYLDEQPWFQVHPAVQVRITT